MKIVILGLSITSSWGNGHATTYRGLVRDLCARGNEVLFLERDQSWCAQNRDLPDPPYGRTGLYSSPEELRDNYAAEIISADAVIVGSFVPDGVEIGEWVTSNAKGITAFYDLDTPVTLSRLERGETGYLAPRLIPRYQLYLSFTGGPVLRKIERELGSPKARALYCSVDVREYFPEGKTHLWDLGYLGTYSDDRQPSLNRFLLQPAEGWDEGRFVVAGSGYPDSIRWPVNVERIQHLPPGVHRDFYNSQRFTLNITRQAMIRAGYSPSVRLFEAAACGTPILSDAWEGLDTLFEPDSEVLIVESRKQVMDVLRTLSEEQRLEIGRRARERVLREHTSLHRAEELEFHIRSTQEELARRPASSRDFVEVSCR